MISCKTLWRNNISKEYQIISDDENEAASDLQINKQQIKDGNTFSVSLQISLVKKNYVDLIIRTEISFEEDEQIESLPQYFPHFTYKSFSPVYIPVFTNQKKLLIHAAKPYAYKITQATKNISIDFFLDAPFLHPSWNYQTSPRASSAMPLQPEGTVYNFQINLSEFSATKTFIPVQQYPYPNAYKAAFILTDHCDFDTEEKLRVFLYGNNNNGWLNRNLKISKGVFAIGAKKNEPKKNDSLEDEEYKKLIDILFNDGSEILPHALKSKGQLTGKEFYEALEKLNAYYHPKTWIDHGSYLKYCYSQGAKENPDFFLIKTLKNYHYNNLWAFHDINIEAMETLNIFSQKNPFPLSVLWLSVKYFFTGKWLIAAHYLRSILHRNYSKNIVIDFLIFAMARTKNIFINIKNKKISFGKDVKEYFNVLFKFKTYQNNIPVPYKSKDVLAYSSPLYLEEGKPITQYIPGDLLMFYTFETTHLPDIYTKRSLQKLISEYGTHIGHTYILNDLPYINSIFKKKKNKYFLVDKWISFLDELSDNVQHKITWNPAMSEYADYIIALQNIFIEYISENEIEIINKNLHGVNGYTLVTPAKFSSKVKIDNSFIKISAKDDNYNFFVIDLTSEEKTRILFV